MQHRHRSLNLRPRQATAAEKRTRGATYRSHARDHSAASIYAGTEPLLLAELLPYDAARASDGPETSMHRQ